ncbi:hypothetical protein M422DRAFT_29044 [Sphaerobolus stellatus SS14]|uniref:Unplaced genomic scaffold SPHSTscaffold_30, whole genome shotgun sequence n=1 Tax=Sphaerobolus stellatus (strain SS14) TaxID=990650 RepID=A0A0C9VUU8_SPHS4|nr:hypothetical protein M422DRAFT_29044 [Sphaerobolus stellatus SS14]
MSSEHHNPIDNIDFRPIGTQQIKIASQTTNAPFEHNRSTSEHLIPLNTSGSFPSNNFQEPSSHNNRPLKFIHHFDNILNTNHDKSLPGQLNFPMSVPGNFDDTNAHNLHSPLLPNPQPSHIPPSPYPPASYPITVSSPQIQPQREIGMENPFPSIYPDPIKTNFPSGSNVQVGSVSSGTSQCYTCTVKDEFSALIRQLANEKRTHTMKTSTKTTFFENLTALLDFLMHRHSHEFEQHN